jgi:exodeoxyribonuclease VII small subunit
MSADQLTFDDGLDQLEAVVHRLENGELGLEEALECYESGIKLSADLQKQLADAQRKVEVLRQGIGGEYTAEALEEEDDDDE